MKKKKVLTIGSGTIDIFLSYEDAQTAQFESKQGTRSCLLLEEGAKIEVTDILYATGGGATNSAASFSHLGLPASICCKFGKNTHTEFVIDALKKESLDLSFIKHTDELPTGTSIILPSPIGNHTILAYRGSNTLLNESDIPFDAFSSFDQLYITSLSGAASNVLLPICKKAHQLDIPIATNPGTSQLAAGADVLRDALEYIDILILNSDEAKKFMHSLVKTNIELQQELAQAPAKELSDVPQLLGSIFYEDICFSLPDYFKEVLKRGPRIAVVTNGKEGVYVATENTIYFHPTIPTTIANTVGAGDAFGSCFVASLMHEYSVEDALLRGILNATSVIGYVTTKEGLLTQAKLEEQVQIFGKPKIQTFKLNK